MTITMVVLCVGFSACSGDDDDNGGGGSKGKAPKGVEAVDLGLPSGTKWANMNIGASHPEDYGDYFQWGETTPCTDHSEDLDLYSNYTPGGVVFSGTSYEDFGTEKDPMFADGTLTKEVINDWYSIPHGDIAGIAKYDAARANWGGKWKMPTKTQWNELEEYCTWTWTEINGMKGYNVKSNKNGNSIFLPAAGIRTRKWLEDAGTYLWYWSSTISNSLGSAWGYDYNSSDYHGGADDRNDGHSVRPVEK